MLKIKIKIKIQKQLEQTQLEQKQAETKKEKTEEKKEKGTKIDYLDDLSSEFSDDGYYFDSSDISSIESSIETIEDSFDSQSFLDFTQSISKSASKQVKTSSKKTSAKTTRKRKKKLKPEELDAQIVIVSYGLIQKLDEWIKTSKFGIIICDESHYIKSPKALRTKALLPILQTSKRSILLSGTPSLGKPIELYTQITAIRPDLNGMVWKGMHQFGVRYCEPQRAVFGYGWEYKGAECMEELHSLLTSFLMIRRKKSEVLTMLPSKIRTAVFSDVTNTEINRLKNSVTNIETLLRRAVSSHKDENESNKNDREAIVKLYKESGKIKVKPTLDFVNDLIDTNQKVLVFAHHR